MDGIAKILTVTFCTSFAMLMVSNRYIGFAIAPWETGSTFEAVQYLILWTAFFGLVAMAIIRARDRLSIPWFDVSALAVPFVCAEIYWRNRLHTNYAWGDWKEQKIMAADLLSVSHWIALVGIFALLVTIKAPQKRVAQG